MPKCWQCSVYGYVHSGEGPPESCPVCGAERTKFVLLEEETPAQSPGLLATFKVHPVAAHFPGGLLPTAAFLWLLSVFFGHPGFEAAAFWLVMIATAVVPVSIGSGLYDWQKHTRTAADLERYKAEPYVVAGDVCAHHSHAGRAGWTWYTGSAAWMYRAWVEEVLGLKVRGDRLQLDPVIPGGWEGFRLRYRHGEAIYEIQVENPEGCERGVSWVEMDGQRISDGVIPLARGLKHRILVHMGKSKQAA